MQSESSELREFLKFGLEARSKLVEGASLLYRSVCSTLSPKGRNVAIARPWGNPIVVHDGVTVAREVKSSDRFTQIGINLVREAATKTNEEAGDGTTTSTLIAYEAIKRGMKLLDEGVNPMILRAEIYAALDQALAELKNITKEAKTVEDLIHVSTISSSNEEIGKLVGEAVYKMGVDGLVSVEESGGYDTAVDHTEGMSLDKGYASPYFITNPNRLEAIVNNAVVIVTDKEVTTNREIVPILEYIIQSEGSGNKNIVIIGDVRGEALKTLVTNKVQGVINCVVIQKPGYGIHTAGMLEDIAVLTGGKVISKELGMSMEYFMQNQQFDDSYLGHAEKVVVGRKNAMIVKGRAKPEEIEVQIQKIREVLKGAKNVIEKEGLEERIAKLTSGVSVIRVGAKTEVEGREKVERVKDAVGASQSALREGIVPGSGVTFLRMAEAIKLDTDGARLLKEVLEAPLKKVMENCGEPDKLIKDNLEKIKKAKEIDFSYEAMTGKLTHMYKVGVIDPTKVIRLCLENGISVATSILTTDTIIDFEDPKMPGQQ